MKLKIEKRGSKFHLVGDDGKPISEHNSEEEAKLALSRLSGEDESGEDDEKDATPKSLEEAIARIQELENKLSSSAAVAQKLQALEEKINAGARASASEKRKKLQQEGKHEELLGELNTEIESLTAANKALARQLEIGKAVSRTKHGYAAEAMSDAVAIVEAETKGSLDADEVIKRAVARAKSWGSQQIEGGDGGSDGSPGAGRGPTADKRLAKLGELFKRAPTDKQAQREFKVLQDELSREGVKIPNFSVQ